jgi:predicted amino acid dehydrogenase
MFRATCLSFLRRISADDAEYVARVCALPPTIVGEVSFGFSLFRGEVVSIPCLPAEVGTSRGRSEILRAARIALDRGATVIGLGALTAPATAGGEWLVEQLPGGVIVTNGNAYTAAVLRRNVLEAAAQHSNARRPCVAVVGCTGSVGTLLSRMLADEELDLVLIGRSTAKVAKVLGDLAAARMSGDLADASAAEIVVALTSTRTARLTPACLQRGALVIDAAEPANISDGEVRAWSAYATVVRGGRVRIPDYHCTYDFGLDEPAETFACLAETYLCARDGIRQHSVGSPDREFAERLERAALRHGVCPASLPGLHDATAAGASAAAKLA